MPDYEHIVYMLREQIDGSIYLHHPLMYPELTNLSTGTASAEVEKTLMQITERGGARALHQRVPGSVPEIHRVTLKVEPPAEIAASLTWIEPVELPVFYAVWNHGDRTTIAWLPTYGINILCQGAFDGNFIGRVRVETRSALVRSNALTGLEPLVWLGRTMSVDMDTRRLKIEVLSPRQAELKRESSAQKDSTLSKVTWRIDDDPAEDKKIRKRKRMIRIPAFERETELRNLAELLAGESPLSVLIVGPSGCGKSSLLNELAARKDEFGMKSTAFRETSGSRIVAGMSGFGQWQERCQNLIDELSKQDAVLHLGNLIELLEVGKSVNQSHGIASYMRTFIQRGTLWAIAECTSEQLSVIEKQDPALLNAFQQLRLETPDEEKTVRILSQVAEFLGSKRAVTVLPEAIDTVCRLHRRYATYSSMPGRPVRFLRNQLEDVGPGIEISVDAVVRSFAAESGLPYFLLSEKQPLDLAETRDWFASRVIGQNDPVDLVVDMLASVKAGLTPTGRPIASFLFVGPTGVGKTEMAKSIAEFMYSDGARMVRIDMSEYNDRMSVERLIGTGGGEGILTSRVRQNPFSVVLLDEFEKAHPAFFDLMLQVLGEGRLTDTRGKVTDFSTSIIIMTSNLGVSSFRARPTGFASADETETHFEDHFVRQAMEFMRPELYNRIDRVVPFGPLSAETVRAVVVREINKLRAREGIWFRGVDLSVEPEAIEHIATHARDARFGARPVQRYIHDNVCVPLAASLNASSVDRSLTANVGIENDVLKFTVKPVEETGEPRDGRTRGGTAVFLVQEQRRRAQRLHSSAAANRIRNEFYRLEQSSERNRKEALKRGQMDVAARSLWENDPKLRRYRNMIDEIDAVQHEAIQIEEFHLLKYFEERVTDRDVLMNDWRKLNSTIDRTTFNLYLFESSGSDKVTLLIFGRNMEDLQLLAEAYQHSAEKREFRTNFYSLCRIPENDNPHLQKERGAVLTLLNEIDPDSVDGQRTPAAEVFRINVNHLFLDPPRNLLGVAIEVNGPAAFAILSPERGIHDFKRSGRTRVLVQAVGGMLVKHDLPRSIGTLGPFDDTEKRVYSFDPGNVVDSQCGRFDMSQETLSEVIDECIARTLKLNIARHLES